MDKRLVLLVAAGIAIVGLCAFKATRSYAPPGSIKARVGSEPAPPFELYDQSTPSKLVRLIGYLGRHRVLVVFFDGREGAHRSVVLNRLREVDDRLRSAGVYVMAISAALPQENRKDAAGYGGFSFPLLSDPDFHVHHAWGRFVESTRKPTQGVFSVNRSGSVAWSAATNHPEPVPNWQATIDDLLAGK